MRRVYVSVIARFDEDGKITPLSVIWEDGTKYDIDRVTDAKRRAAMKAGGAGMRYTCLINGHETYVFFDGERWFVEGKN